MISCWQCKKINLMNVETEQVMEAYSGEKVKSMCHGRDGRLFASLQGTDRVIELDCSSSKFSHKNTVCTGLKYSCSDLCYLPPTHDCVVVCDADEV